MVFSGDEISGPTVTAVATQESRIITVSCSPRIMQCVSSIQPLDAYNLLNPFTSFHQTLRFISVRPAFPLHLILHQLSRHARPSHVQPFGNSLVQLPQCPTDLILAIHPGEERLRRTFYWPDNLRCADPRTRPHLCSLCLFDPHY